MERQDAKDAREPEEPGARIDAVASATLHAAIEVHRVLGPGFLELKAVDHIAPVHLLKAMALPLALVIHFHVPVLLRGVRRVVRSPSV